MQCHVEYPSCVENMMFAIAAILASPSAPPIGSDAVFIGVITIVGWLIACILLCFNLAIIISLKGPRNAKLMHAGIFLAYVLLAILLNIFSYMFSERKVAHTFHTEEIAKTICAILTFGIPAAIITHHVYLKLLRKSLLQKKPN